MKLANTQEENTLPKIIYAIRSELHKSIYNNPIFESDIIEEFSNSAMRPENPRSKHITSFAYDSTGKMITMEVDEYNPVIFDEIINLIKYSLYNTIVKNKSLLTLDTESSEWLDHSIEYNSENIRLLFDAGIVPTSRIIIRL